MKKWKIAFGIAAFVAIGLAAALVWQNHQIKEDLLRAYILEHASLEQALAISLDEYDSAGDASQLSADLVIAYGQSQVVMQPADVRKLTGGYFRDDIPYLMELQGTWDSNMTLAIQDTMVPARSGEVAEEQVQELKAHYDSLLAFNKILLSNQFEKKGLAELESDIEKFYMKYVLDGPSGF
ncbi:hypothetical protein ACTL32_10010 [Planococcus sp. FY231025]|uniref:hypothetical protein n=1 Tax=Planococcus sp. FY231025 TaxID=3455699 RepID=UPI003F90E995